MGLRRWFQRSGRAAPGHVVPAGSDPEGADVNPDGPGHHEEPFAPGSSEAYVMTNPGLAAEAVRQPHGEPTEGDPYEPDVGSTGGDFGGHTGRSDPG